jgi:hypothetical protein
LRLQGFRQLRAQLRYLRVHCSVGQAEACTLAELGTGGQKRVITRYGVLTFVVECAVPVPALLSVKSGVTNELQGMIWPGVVIKFAFSNVVSRTMYIAYCIWVTD